MIKNAIIILTLFVFCTTIFGESYTTMNNSGGRPTQQTTSTLVVSKSGPENGTLGQAMTITISITNSGSQRFDGYVYEDVGNYDVVGQQVNRINITDGNVLAARAPQITWNLSINGGETKTIQYEIKPKTVGLLTIGPTEVVSGNSAFRSNAVLINIACSASSSCDERLGETPLNCPEKCGGNATITPAVEPDLAYIPTPAINGPIANAANTPPPQSVIDEKSKMQTMLYAGIGIVLLLFAVVIYKKMANKKV